MDQTEKISTWSAQIQSLLKEILKDDNRDTGLLCDYIDKTVVLAEQLHDENQFISRTPNIDSELENAAVSLWNFAVCMKTKGALSTLSNAKLRYISLLLVDTFLKDEDDSIFKKKIMMGIKTARACLDAGRHQLADQVLQMTDGFVKACQKVIVEKINSNGPSDQLKQQKIDMEQDVFKILCYRAECFLAVGKCQEALEMVLLAKEMLVNFPKEGAFLSMMCYNFGVDMYQKKRFEEAVTWLRESFELGKGRHSIGSKNQARTMRLLASTYIDWNPQEHLQKALNAVTLANAEHPHPAGLYIKLRILLINGDPDDVVGRAVEEILLQTDVSVDMVLALTELLTKSKRFEVSKEVLTHSVKRFANSPDLGKLQTTHLEMLLQSQQAQAAKHMVEQCITDHNTGKPLDKDVLKRFHVLLWEKAGEEFENKSYQESLEWYNYSLSLYEAQPDDKNLAKLHRNRANCYIHLHMNAKAEEALQAAEKHDSGSVYTQFTIYKLALAESNIEKARSSLHKMCELAPDTIPEDSDVHGLICLAAHMAFEQQQQLTASEALECLANTSPDHLQVLTALRCLIRMNISDSTGKRLQQADPVNK